MNLSDYKKAFKAITTIVNEIDPSYFNGPEDEYEYQVNQIIKIYQQHNAWPKDLELILIKLFFGSQVVSDEEKDMIHLLAKKLLSVIN